MGYGDGDYISYLQERINALREALERIASDDIPIGYMPTTWRQDVARQAKAADDRALAKPNG